MAIFFCFSILAGAFGGLLAAVISHLSGTLGLAGWQWIFILKAIPTILLAGLTLLIMIPSLDKAMFLTAKERVYSSKRVEVDRDFHVTLQSSWKHIASVLTDPRMYLVCLCSMFLRIGNSGMVMFLPTLILDMGFKV
jgi:MFS family permease